MRDSGRLRMVSAASRTDALRLMFAAWRVRISVVVMKCLRNRGRSDHVGMMAAWWHGGLDGGQQKASLPIRSRAAVGNSPWHLGHRFRRQMAPLPKWQRIGCIAGFQPSAACLIDPRCQPALLAAAMGVAGKSHHDAGAFRIVPGFRQG